MLGHLPSLRRHKVLLVSWVDTDTADGVLGPQAEQRHVARPAGKKVYIRILLDRCRASTTQMAPQIHFILVVV